VKEYFDEVGNNLGRTMGFPLGAGLVFFVGGIVKMIEGKPIMTCVFAIVVGLLLISMILWIHYIGREQDVESNER